MVIVSLQNIGVNGVTGTKGMRRFPGTRKFTEAKMFVSLCLCILLVVGSWVTLTISEDQLWLNDNDRTGEESEANASLDGLATPLFPADPQSLRDPPVRSSGTRGGGNGTKDNPYLITDVDELQDMKNKCQLRFLP